MEEKHCLIHLFSNKENILFLLSGLSGFTDVTYKQHYKINWSGYPFVVAFLGFSTLKTVNNK